MSWPAMHAVHSPVALIQAAALENSLPTVLRLQVNVSPLHHINLRSCISDLSSAGIETDCGPEMHSMESHTG